MANNNLKEKAYAKYILLVEEKINRLQQNMEELREGLASETKSTAGDKYETGRAMVHIEQENLGRQLQTLQAQKAGLGHIDITLYTGKVIAGSLVRTSKGYLFLSVALGKVLVDEVAVFALSPSAPLGLQLMGRIAGDQVSIQKEVYIIEEIL